MAVRVGMKISSSHPGGWAAWGSWESSERWDEVTRGRVEQLCVTANQRATLRMESRERKGNAQIKHKHKTSVDKSPSPQSSEQQRQDLNKEAAKLILFKHRHLNSFSLLSSTWPFYCYLLLEKKIKKTYMYIFKVSGNRFLMFICPRPPGSDLWHLK